MEKEYTQWADRCGVVDWARLKALDDRKQ